MCVFALRLHCSWLCRGAAGCWSGVTGRPLTGEALLLDSIRCSARVSLGRGEVTCESISAVSERPRSTSGCAEDPWAPRGTHPSSWGSEESQWSIDRSQLDAVEDSAQDARPASSVLPLQCSPCCVQAVKAHPRDQHNPLMIEALLQSLNSEIFSALSNPAALWEAHTHSGRRGKGSSPTGIPSLATSCRQVCCSTRIPRFDSHLGRLAHQRHGRELLSSQRARLIRSKHPPRQDTLHMNKLLIIVTSGRDCGSGATCNYPRVAMRRRPSPEMHWKRRRGQERSGRSRQEGGQSRLAKQPGICGCYQ